MSNSLSIAIVTEAFRTLLEEAAKHSGVSSAVATKVRPTPLNNAGMAGGLPASGVNLYLYQVSPNPAFRNADLPGRRRDGSVLAQSRSAYDLSYLLTFYGEENSFEPQVVLGSVLQKLHSEPQLTPQRIKNAQDTVRSDYQTTDPNLQPDLLQEVEAIKLSLTPLGLEELSKLWSVFFQIPYSLSLAAQASVVFIDGRETAHPALPVLSRNVYVRAFRSPLIERVLSQKDPAGPILADQPISLGDILVLDGKLLKGDQSMVRLGNTEIAPLDMSETRLRFQLGEPPFPTDTLRAGVAGVQVVQHLPMGTPATDHRGFESNVAAFILRPAIKVTNSPVVKSPAGAVTWYDTDLTIQCTPKVALGQRVFLMLNEADPPPDRPAYSYQYDLTTAPYPAGPALTSLKAHIHLSTPADFLVRLQVDGAESVDPGPDLLHPSFHDPMVAII
jgi:hypothetical protein